MDHPVKKKLVNSGVEGMVDLSFLHNQEAGRYRCFNSSDESRVQVLRDTVWFSQCNLARG